MRVDESIRFGDRAASELRREAKDGSMPVLIIAVVGAFLLLLLAIAVALVSRQRRLTAELAGARREPHSSSEDMSADQGGSRHRETAGTCRHEFWSV